MQDRTPITGITTATPNTTSQDGETRLLVNLRPNNRTLQPVSSGQLIGTLSQTYGLIYLHTTNTTQNWIGVIGNTLYTSLLSIPVKIHTLDTPILRIHHIATILIVFTASGIFHLLYRDNLYIPLGYKPPFPYILHYYNFKSSGQKFDTITGTITDIQATMEALLTKARWQEDSADKLAGVYLMRYALRLFDGSYICHSGPILIHPYPKLVHPYRVNLGYIGENFRPEYSSVTINQFTVSLIVDTSALYDWKDIIASVDIFLSTEQGIISNTFKKIEDCDKTISDTDPHTHLRRESFCPQDIDKDTILSNISDTGNFYLVKSIPVSKGETTVTFPQKSEITNIQNLVHQPTLPADDFSHHNVTATYAYAYNQRLHLANIQTTYFNGFNLLAFVRRKKPETPGGGGPTRPGSTSRPEDTTPEIQIDNAYIEICINTPDTANARVTAHISNIKITSIAPLFSYPDTRAYKATICYCDTNNNILRKIEIPLKPHNTLNLAYYIDTSLQEITLDEATGKYTPDYTPLHSVDNHKIKVSALQNPFLFPNENTYVTAGKVTGMAANTQPVSEGQFGQFPLYVFTDAGIYAMSTGSGEVVYSNIVPVSEEIALPGTIAPVAEAVFFLTLRGAYLIAGSQTTFISGQLNADTPSQAMQHYQQIMALLFPALPSDNRSFLDFIQLSGLSVHFNYIQNELLIISQQAGYAYVHNFHSQAWYITTHTFTPIQNAYPHLFGIVGKNVIDISAETDTPTPVLILTRPLKLHSQQYKTLHRFILRSRITNTTDAGLFTFASNDAENFILKSNLRLPPGSYRDIDTGLIPAATYRYFALLFSGTLTPDSRIDYIETTCNPTYNNDKLR